MSTGPPHSHNINYHQQIANFCKQYSIISMQQTLMQRSVCQGIRPVAAQRPTPSRTHTTLVRAETRQPDGEKVARSKDSYEKIEEPVRKNWPEGSNVVSTLTEC